MPVFKERLPGLGGVDEIDLEALPPTHKSIDISATACDTRTNTTRGDALAAAQEEGGKWEERRIREEGGEGRIGRRRIRRGERRTKEEEKEERRGGGELTGTSSRAS